MMENGPGVEQESSAQRPDARKRKGSINRSTTTNRIFGGQESVAHPSSCRSVAANVGKALFMIPVRRAKRDFLDRLVNNQTLRRKFTNTKSKS
jgi:hypothetical protein